MPKKKGKRKLRLLSVILTASLLLTVVCCTKQFLTLRELQAKQLYYEGVDQDLVQENTELLNTKDLLNDASYMERLARQRFKLIRPNEYLVVPAETNEDLQTHVELDDKDVH